MHPWVHGIFGGIFLALFGAALVAFGAWLALRLEGWRRWLSVVLVLAGAILVFAALGVVVDRFNRPDMFR